MELSDYSIFKNTMAIKSKKDSSEPKKRLKREKTSESPLFDYNNNNNSQSQVEGPFIETVTQELKDEVKTDNSSTLFSYDKPIYLQIHRQNIFHYFISGLISPTLYENSRPQIDLQTAFKVYLGLSNGLVDKINEDHALIELSFNDSERKNIKIVSSIGLLSKPIPISRVKKIYLATKFAKTDVLATAQSTDGGIIPENLIVERMPESLETIFSDEQIHENNQVDVDYKSAIAEYDRLMGAYAFAKNSLLLTANRSNIYSNYSDQYLGFVKLLLNISEIPTDLNSKHLNFYKHLLRLNNEDENLVLKWLMERTKTGLNFTSTDITDFANLLLKPHQNTTFKEIGKEALTILNDGIKRKSAPNFILENIEHKDKFYLYIFSFLYIYGNRAAEDRTNSRIGVSNEAAIPYVEFIFTLLGYFYGYSLLRNNDEKQNYSDGIVRKLADQNSTRPPIKFELTTLFDYHLIEAIYQYAFKGSVSMEVFQYIQPKELSLRRINVPENLSSEYDFTSFEILGKEFFKLVKKQ